MSEGYFLSKKRWTTRAGEWSLYAIAWVLRLITRPLPTRWLIVMSGTVGGALMMAIPSVRRRALRNLELVWPDRPVSQRKAIARGAAQQFSKLGAEYSRLDTLARDGLIEAEGIEVVTTAKEAGKGAILVTAHFGNWEAARLAAKQAGCETGIIYRAFNNRYLDRYAMNLIPHAGAPVLQKGSRGMRRLVSHVAGGGFVMILVDQRNSGAPFLNFLGHPAETVTAAADLAHRTGAALIPARAVRCDEALRFDVTFEQPITGTTSLEMMQRVNDRISAWIEEHPEQWFWFHRRWRSTIRSRELPTISSGEISPQ